MKIITPSIDIESTDGFKKSALNENREKFGISLRNLVEKSKDELVISIDGKWGEGKTTFVKMWQGLLNENEIPNIYIDAFANDYTSDAFISIASPIINYFQEKIEPGMFDEFKSRARQIGVQALSFAAKVTLKAATLGAINSSDIQELKDIKDDIANGASSLAGNIIEQQLGSHAKEIESLESFKTLLSNLPQNINSSSEKPFVIIIDELDRCKPTFAVEIIEKIKHLFSTKNIVFVLVMNKEQLEIAIKSVYGSEIDACTYLQKFINIETTLPKVIIHPDENDVKKYCYKLHELHEFGDNEYALCITKQVVELARHFNLSLRNLEKVYTNIAIFYISCDENESGPFELLALLSVIKITHPFIFTDLQSKPVPYNKIKEVINLTERSKNVLVKHMMIWLKIAMTISDDEFNAYCRSNSSEISPYLKDIRKRNINRHNLVTNHIEKLSTFSVIEQ